MISHNTVFTLRLLTEPWSARGITGEADSADNPARLSGGATQRLRRLKPLGFVNKRTLDETCGEHLKTKIP
ncbi:hypothetical protein [Paenibacillus alginolyticus]|uniref:Uncharacterized protein n=1 Tax=Paenibacillus alginolyticus TaxID=59839 RepID=A0ABT4GF20_9BACL|nr:hypothetical protein [Paenibacillus alginolyticus]MCY9694774.1 hypothetical protein [Paenibacillus alginolyticus]MEC0147054.1 hypothetical protein [Paenibacillus alginolyticus]